MSRDSNVRLYGIVRQMNASNVRHEESVRPTDLILWFDD